MRRIVVTGLGLVSPLGCGAELAWSRLTSGKSALTALPSWAAALPARVAGLVPTKANDPKGGRSSIPISPCAPRSSGRWIASSCLPWPRRQRPSHRRRGLRLDTSFAERTATIIASGIGGFPAIVELVRTTDQRGVRRLSPFTAAVLSRKPCGRAQLSIRYGYKGAHRRARHGLRRQCAGDR